MTKYKKVCLERPSCIWDMRFIFQNIYFDDIMHVCISVVSFIFSEVGAVRENFPRHRS